MTYDTGLTGGTAATTVSTCMYGFLRQPKWIVFHVVCVVVSATMAILGVGQVLHLQDRSERNDAVSATSHAPIVPLSDLLAEAAAGSPAAVEYRRAEATGLSVPATPTGEVHVTGRVRLETDGGAVDNDAISATLGDDVAPVYLELLESDPDEPDTVRPIPFPDLSDGPHLRYALQWFAFSGCVLLGWWVLVRKRYLRLQTGRL